MYARIQLILALLLGAFLITFNFSACEPEIPGDDDDDNDATSDDDVTGDDDVTDDDDTTPDDDDDITDDDDDTLPVYSVDFTTDCDQIVGLPGDPTIYVDDEQVGASPVNAGVTEGEHDFDVEGPNILAVNYNNYEINEDRSFHFRCGLAPEGVYDGYDAPCGQGGEFQGPIEFETVIVSDQVKLSVDGAPSYFIRGSEYYYDDPQNILGTISVDLTEINGIASGYCFYLQE